LSFLTSLNDKFARALARRLPVLSPNPHCVMTYSPTTDITSVDPGWWML
jgi:hypothetical protein